jgi:GT2 family glycosyltransferase
MSATACRTSVVIPTHNRADRLERLLDALSRQDMGEMFEVVVADDASSDDTVARVSARPPSEYFDLVLSTSTHNGGPAVARNRGWQAARGDLIVFTDDDCVPDPSWLRTVVGALETADIVVGRTKPPADQLDRIGPFSNYLDLDHDQSFSTCNVGYRRPVLEKVGGFDESFVWPNGEDTDLGLRALKAGFADAYTPDALVWHDVSPSEFGAHLTRMRRLDGIVALIARHPEARAMVNASWFLRSVDKAVLIAWVAGLALAARPRRATKAFAALAVALYVWQFTRSHYKARSLPELVVSIPLGFVADSFTVAVLARSSLRHRTLLL